MIERRQDSAFRTKKTLFMPCAACWNNRKGVDVGGGGFVEVERTLDDAHRAQH